MILGFNKKIIYYPTAICEAEIVGIMLTRNEKLYALFKM